MLATLLLLLAVTGPPPADFSLVLTTTEGGINPGEDVLELHADGSVLHRASRLVAKENKEERWRVGTTGVAAVRTRLARVDLAALEGTVNQARGSQVAFTITLRVSEEGGTHEVRAFTFGKPAPPEELTRLVEDLRTLLADPASPRTAP